MAHWYEQFLQVGRNSVIFLWFFQVMEKIGRNEIHDTKINREDPDWFLIYNYVASLLKAEELPELGQIGAVPRLLLQLR